MKWSHPTHDHSALVLLLCVVIRLVAQGYFLLLDFSSEFSVDMETGAGLGQGVILKDPAHVVEQASGRQHDGGRTEVTLPFQEELSVLVPLGGGAAEPVHRLDLILLHTLPHQVQLTKHVLGILVVRFCRLCEPIYRFGGIFSQHLAGQILLSQPVGGPGNSLGRRFFQPADAFVRVSDFGIVREKQLAQGIARKMNVMAWARVIVVSGLNVVELVPEVIPCSAAQITAS